MYINILYIHLHYHNTHLFIYSIHLNPKMELQHLWANMELQQLLNATRSPENPKAVSNPPFGKSAKKKNLR